MRPADRPTSRRGARAAVLTSRRTVAATVLAALLAAVPSAVVTASASQVTPAPGVGTVSPVEPAPEPAPAPEVGSAEVGSASEAGPLPGEAPGTGQVSAPAAEEPTGPVAVGPSAEQRVAAAAVLPVPPVPFLTAPEATSRFQAQVTCDPTEKPGAVRLRTLLRSTYGRGTTNGISRACSVGGTSHHKEGRAYDWGLNAYDPADAALADEFLTWLVGPDAQGQPAGNARRLGLQYVIWDREIWNASSGVWKPYTGVSPHTDHIHFSLSWDGAFARTSFWTGTAVTKVDHGPCQVYVGVLVAPWAAPNYTACPAPRTPTALPVGNLEQVRTALAGAAFAGWARDPDTSSPVTVQALVGGAVVASTVADRARPDVGPHGFDLTVPLATGTHEVCLSARDVGTSGLRTSLGCRTVSTSSSPIGRLEQVGTVTGGVLVSGWTLDPDTTGAIDVDVRVDGRSTATLRAGQSRPDVAAAYPGQGRDHGFSGTVSVAPGAREVCVHALDVGAGGSDTLLGCRTVLVLGSSPTGALTAAVPAFGLLTVSGWAMDGDTTDPLSVHVYVDGVGVGRGTADLTQHAMSHLRPGQAGGYSSVVPLPGGGGAREVCAYAINGGSSGGNTLLGCRTVTVDGAPRGAFEAAVGAGGRVTVSGWVIDPDVAVGTVHVYVDGTGAALRPTAARADVAAAHPAFAGSTPGWSASYPAAPGVRQVCAYAINSGPGTTTVLGCRSVTVPSGSPFGSLERVAAAGGHIEVSGWVVDPDVPTGTVHVYVDGRGVALASDAKRPDVAAHHPAYASWTPGFSGRWAASPGKHEVCVYGINSGPGGTLAMGCRTVTVLSGSPVGALEAVVPVAGGVDVSGWVVDPDVLVGSVHVYVDTVGTALRPTTTRPDVAAAFPAFASHRHGWSARLPAAPGLRRVCAYGMDTGPGSTLVMRCVSVMVTG